MPIPAGSDSMSGFTVCGILLTWGGRGQSVPDVPGGRPSVGAVDPGPGVGGDARCNGSGCFRLGGPTRIGTPVSAAAIICMNRVFLTDPDEVEHAMREFLLSKAVR